MKNRQHFKSIISIFAILPFVLFFISCGGGGGGSDDGNTSTISYIGSTTQASITEDNATDLATESYTNGSLGNSMSGIAASQTEYSKQVYAPRMLKVSYVLKDSLFKVDLTSRSGGIFAGAVYQATDTIAGSCGGSASYTISVNDQTGAFSGSFIYSNYCNGGAVINGSVDFSGTVDVTTEEILTFSFSFNNLSSTLGGDSVTVRGDLSFDMTGSPIVLTMTIWVKDNSTNRVYWIKDYRLEITEVGNCVEIDISGRFYHPDHGYVTLSTVQVLTICGLEEYPSSGELLITGKGGTTARIIFLSSTTYQVIADTNGNGSYDDLDDFDTGELNWTDL